MYTGDRGVTRQRGFMRSNIKIKLVYLCHPITGLSYESLTNSFKWHNHNDLNILRFHCSKLMLLFCK